VNDDALTAEEFHEWLDSIDELDIVVPTSETFQIVLLLDHTYIASEDMWELLTIPTNRV
jgi:hypothetical protein